MKTPKNYRLTAETLEQIEWLARRLGVSATETIQRAIRELFEHEREKMRLRARPLEDGRYELTIDDLPVAIVPEAVLDKVGRYKAEMVNGGVDESVFGLVFVAAARVKDQPSTFFTENIERVYEKMPSMGL